MSSSPYQDDVAGKHRREALRKLDSQMAPETRQITFSIVARCRGGGKEATIPLSLDDDVTTVLGRIRSELQLHYTPSMSVEWSSVNGGKHKSDLTEETIEATLGLLWKSKSYHSSLPPVYPVWGTGMPWNMVVIEERVWKADFNLIGTGSVETRDILVVDVHGESLMKNRRPTSSAGDNKTEEPQETSSAGETKTEEPKETSSAGGNKTEEPKETTPAGETETEEPMDSGCICD